METLATRPMEDVAKGAIGARARWLGASKRDSDFPLRIRIKGGWSASYGCRAFSPVQFSHLNSDPFEKLAGADNADVSTHFLGKVSLVARHDEISLGRYGAS
jgi:hypothetical protein